MSDSCGFDSISHRTEAQAAPATFTAVSHPRPEKMEKVPPLKKEAKVSSDNGDFCSFLKSGTLLEKTCADSRVKTSGLRERTSLNLSAERRRKRITPECPNLEPHSPNFSASVQQDVFS